MERILTNNAGEKITVTWDGERFALVHHIKDEQSMAYAIILNPKEMLDLVEFARLLAEKEVIRCL